MTDPPRVVFSDVDDTIIREKSLFSWLRFGAELTPPLDPRERAELDAMLERLRSGELSRSDANELYYQYVLSGRDVASVRALGRRWFSEGMARPQSFLHVEVVSFLKAARSRGFELVLVTGSFSELLEPLAVQLDASAILGAPLEREGGKYTGRLLGPATIGSGKARAVLSYAAARGLDLSRCVAIGDDTSDLELLRCVGTPLLPPAADPRLLALGREMGWKTVSQQTTIQA